VFDFGGAEVEQCVLWRKCGRRKILRDSETTLTDPRRRKRTCRCRGWLLHRAAGVSGLLRVLSLSHAPAVVVSLDRARAVITATEVLHPARPVRRVAPDDRLRATCRRLAVSTAAGLVFHDELCHGRFFGLFVHKRIGLFG
jgi:hypothetical protein